MSRNRTQDRIDQHGIDVSSGRVLAFGLAMSFSQQLVKTDSNRAHLSKTLNQMRGASNPTQLKKQETISVEAL